MDEYIIVQPDDEQYINEISHILFRCGLHMAKKFMLHWIKPYPKSAIRNDCTTKTVILVKDIESGIFTSTFQMLVTDQGNLYARKLATRPDCEGQGIGKRNMQYILAYAKTHGYPKVSLDVYKKSQRAIGLYIKLGFVIIGETKARFFSEYIMEKEI